MGFTNFMLSRTGTGFFFFAVRILLMNITNVIVEQRQSWCELCETCGEKTNVINEGNEGKKCEGFDMCLD